MKNWVHNFIYVFILLVVILLTFSYFGKEVFLAPTAPEPSTWTISLEPNVVVNNLPTNVIISGTNLESVTEVLLNGMLLDASMASWNFNIATGRITISFSNGFPVGVYDVSVGNSAG